MAIGQPIRLTANVKVDPEQLIHPDDVAAAMQTTLQLLAETGIGPAQSIAIVVLLPDEIKAFDLREQVRAALREGRRLTAAVAQRGVCRTCCGSGRQRRSAPDGTYLGMGPCPDCQEASRRPDIVH